MNTILCDSCTRARLSRRVRRLVFSALASVAAALSPLAAAGPVVDTAQGEVEGRAVGTEGVHAFWGIPYAAPPVETLRWRSPKPAKPWDGVRLATAFGPRCMQQDGIFHDLYFRSPGMSEDCLYLNIWTGAVSPDERRPVLVYFHGGGFVGGDGSEPRYDGQHMAERGIVMVTVNYRMGVFGFLAYPELSAETSYGGSGNYGLLDQAAALRWVYDNIAAFGGDPDRITIGGESAGSVSVSAQMASPLSRGLIAGAIGESGSILGALPAVSLAEGEAAGRQFAEAAGAADLDDLRHLSAQKLLALEAEFGPFRFPRTVDGHFFPKSPQAIYQAGEQAPVPLLAGSNSEEMPARVVLEDAPPTVASYREAVRRLYGEQADQVLQAYPAETDGEAVLDAAQALAGDRFIAHSTWKWMDLVTSTGGKPTFYYYYDRVRPPLKPDAKQADNGWPPARGAFHAVEIEYALGNLDRSPQYDWQEQDYRLSEVMQGYFLRFVMTGDPNGPGLPEWPAYHTGQRMILGETPRAVPDFAAPRGEVLDALEAAP